ncbi:MAG: ABC transporter ATP-binding protein [Solirubrobacteraceae bacterium]
MVLAVIIAVVVVGVVVALFGWDRYRGDRKSQRAGGSATPTAEVFVDPDSGRRMRVWQEAGTGRREYRVEDPSDAGFGAKAPVAPPPTERSEPLRQVRPSDHGTAIEVNGLTKHFGSTVAVQGLSFSVAAGRIVGFLGPNGAGKTTTMRALLGLISPTAGSATIEGRRYAELKHPAQTVGALLDGDDLHSGRSGVNHLRVLARAAGVPRARVDQLLELVELTGAANRRAGGYSMGMRQRLGLAAALLGDPHVLVLDEPANGLDPQGIRWLRDFLRSLAAEGRAVLISSHVLAEVSQIADDVVVINRGQSVLQAPLAELIARRSGSVRVAGPEVTRLAELLRSDGAQVQPSADGAIVVADRSGEQIGRVIAEHQIVVSELAAQGESLEDVFLELTGAEGGPS